MPVGTSYSIKNVSLSLLGAIVDLDLGVGCGSNIPDRSGRYHGVVNGTLWYHYVPRCPVPMTTPPGEITINGLRRYVQRGVALVNTGVQITHGLGTRDVTVMCYQDDSSMAGIPAKIEMGLTIETVNAVKIWPQVFPIGATATVVIVG